MDEISLEKRIVDHLKMYHLGKWVSPACATSVVTNNPLVFEALSNLIKRKIIDKKYVNNLPFVRYIEPYRKLRVVK